MVYTYTHTCKEKGIYCELNLPDCITYALPPSTTSNSLSKLRSALIEKDRELGQRKGQNYEGRQGGDVDTSTYHMSHTSYNYVMCERSVGVAMGGLSVVSMPLIDLLGRVNGTNSSHLLSAETVRELMHTLL